MRIFTIGETTYDILFRDGQPTSACSGGSAYNSAISLGRCRLPVSLITTFGNDRTGDISLAFLKQNGVNCDHIKRFDGQSRIALAFLDADNNAEYSFYHASKDVFPDYPEPRTGDILLLGSSFALRDHGREQLIAFLKQANKARCTIIYDPNARHQVQGNSEVLKKIMENIALATIIKGSDQDFANIFGLADAAEVYSQISPTGSKLLIYTKGAMGAELISANDHLIIPSKKINVVSTVGAGDNFTAGIVYGLYKETGDNLSQTLLSPDQWEKIMSWGIFFASEVCKSHENYIPDETAKMLSNLRL